MSTTNTKPLGRKAYGSIGHLPCSRMGPGDHAVPEGMAKICTVKTRDKHDRVIVQEKLDGSCVAVARVGDELIPLGRAGWTAVSSPYEQHRVFHDWAMANAKRFMAVLKPGERIVGEWLAQAHGTRYTLPDWAEPFAAFDIIADDNRLLFDEFCDRVVMGALCCPQTFRAGDAMSIEDALQKAGEFGVYGATDPIEGVVYRVERKGKVDFLAKYVRPDKVDGCYLPELTGCEAVWNWRPLTKAAD